MSKENWNIVQVEFFHVGPPPGVPIEEVRAMCAERYVDGLPLKTNVRFYDQQGTVTRAMSEIARIDHIRGIWEERLYTAKPESAAQRLCGWRHGGLFRKMTRMRAELTSIVFGQFILTIEDSAPVALQDDAIDFHVMSADEVAQTRQLIEEVGHVWVFLFAPNDDLCSGKNEVIASAL